MPEVTIIKEYEVSEHTTWKPGTKVNVTQEMKAILQRQGFAAPDPVAAKYVQLVPKEEQATEREEAEQATTKRKK